MEKMLENLKEIVIDTWGIWVIIVILLVSLISWKKKK